MRGEWKRESCVHRRACKVVAVFIHLGLVKYLSILPACFTLLWQTMREARNTE